jgi:hypothetical protein
MTVRASSTADRPAARRSPRRSREQRPGRRPRSSRCLSGHGSLRGRRGGRHGQQGLAPTAHCRPIPHARAHPRSVLLLRRMADVIQAARSAVIRRHPAEDVGQEARLPARELAGPVRGLGPAPARLADASLEVVLADRRRTAFADPGRERRRRPGRAPASTLATHEATSVEIHHGTGPSPFSTLQRLCAGRRFDRASDPPRARGITWSIVRLSGCVCSRDGSIAVWQR